MSAASYAEKLQRASSRKWNIVLGLVLLAVFLFSLALRLYVIEPVRIVGNALDSRLSPGDLVWVCKLPFCTNKLTRNDIVLVSLNGQDPILRSVFGLPGDSIRIFPDGKIQSGENTFQWEDESEIIAPREFYIPRQGDSISFSELNDIAFDYASLVLQNQFGAHRYYTQAQLLRENDTLPLSRVGSAHIFGRPVSIREIHGFHWQEYFIISLQINREEPGAKPVRFERKIYNAQDSTEIKGFRSPDDFYYLICTKGNHYADSRQLGFIAKKQIIGKVVRAQTLFQH